MGGDSGTRVVPPPRGRAQARASGPGERSSPGGLGCGTRGRDEGGERLPQVGSEPKTRKSSSAAGSRQRLPQPVQVVVALCIVAATLAAQSQWTQLAPSSPVSSITGCGLAYDASRDRVVRYGGYSCDGSSQTWEWEGERWQRRFPVVSPPSRTGVAMIYDPYRKRTVMFGGYSVGLRRVLNDLWEWDGTTWTQRPTLVRPPARKHHAMAYDQARRCIVLFGGQNDSVLIYDDTWTWDGSAWREHLPATRPPPLVGAAMAYDPVRERCVLFGGIDGRYPGFPSSDETWEWDGSNWTLQKPASRPAARTGLALAYDHQRRQMILFGGVMGTVIFADTWGWDGQQWTLLVSAGLPGRRGHRMVYDSRRGQVLLHGGSSTICLNDTWALEPAIPGYSGFGSGCVGPRGIPQLSLLTGRETLGLRLSGLATGPHPVVFLLGGSRQQWGTLSLPYTLAGLAPQCALWVAPQIAIPANASAGTATLTFPAGSAQLLGSVHAQGVALDSTAGSPTISMSGAATITPTLLVR